MDQGLDSDASTAAPGPEEAGDSEGPDGVDLVDIDAPSDADPDDAGVEVSESVPERPKKVAASLTHLLTHTPKNPYCSVCNCAKAIRRQQRKARNKGLKVPRPYANLVVLGHLTTMDHWFAMDDLSRGLHDETACVTFRDRATDFLAAQGVYDKFAVHVCN